ncbi:unnamed protein product [Symbiodinium pilosum]|uniref:Pentatricopeptide repeat-containing protein n=1 Tax=Symbiodinium pilosum TaxID=2952 RepID=A0A812WJ23_SYMPI|nr:unnamed protein product [Symbiodinium pilosum]
MWTAALQLFARMRKDRVKITSVSCNALLSALEKGRQWTKITKAAHKLGGRRVTSQVSYNCVASACEKSLVWRAALCFRGPQPDAVAVAVHPGPMCCYSRKAQSMFSTRHRRRCAAAAGTTSTTVGAIYVHAHLGSTRSISACESPSCKSNFSNRGT